MNFLIINLFYIVITYNYKGEIVILNLQYYTVKGKTNTSYLMGM